MAEIAFLIIAIASCSLLSCIDSNTTSYTSWSKKLKKRLLFYAQILMSHFIRLMKSWLKLLFWSKMSTEKFKPIDPLFVAVAELSESVSDLNTEAPLPGAKASAAGASVGKAGSAYAVGVR